MVPQRDGGGRSVPVRQLVPAQKEKAMGEVSKASSLQLQQAENAAWAPGWQRYEGHFVPFPQAFLPPLACWKAPEDERWMLWAQRLGTAFGALVLEQRTGSSRHSRL